MIAAAEFVRPAGMALLDKLAQLGVPLADLTADSRTVKLGSIFVAYPGTAQDGRAYIAEAISRGATAVIWERDGFSWKEAWEIPNLGIAWYWIRFLGVYDAAFLVLSLWIFESLVIE